MVLKLLISEKLLCQFLRFFQQGTYFIFILFSHVEACQSISSQGQIIGIPIRQAMGTLIALPHPHASLPLSSIAIQIRLIDHSSGISKLGYSFSSPWILAKIACWLVLSILAGFAFRKPGIAGVLKLVAAAVVVTAVYCVYMKPGA